MGARYQHWQIAHPELARHFLVASMVQVHYLISQAKTATPSPIVAPTRQFWHAGDLGSLLLQAVAKQRPIAPATASKASWRHNDLAEPQVPSSSPQQDRHLISRSTLQMTS